MIKTVRLIDVKGNGVASAQVRTNADAIIFANQVYLFAFTQGQFDYYREVHAERIREISQFSADNFFTAPQSAERK